MDFLKETKQEKRRLRPKLPKAAVSVNGDGAGPPGRPHAGSPKKGVHDPVGLLAHLRFEDGPGVGGFGGSNHRT